MNTTAIVCCVVCAAVSLALLNKDKVPVLKDMKIPFLEA